jgi:two-component system, NtrC family, sensor histidine kinase PilS
LVGATPFQVAQQRHIGTGDSGLDILAVVASRIAMFVVLFWTAQTFDQESIAHGLILVYGLSTILYLATWASSYRSNNASPVGLLLFFQFLVELLVEAAIFYSNDGYLSDYGLLFILTILSAGFFFRYIGSLIVAAVASAVFVYAGLVHLGMPSPVEFALPRLLMETVQVRFFLYTTLFFMVALLSSLLGGRLLAARRELAGAHEALDLYQFSAEMVMNDLPTGLLFFDDMGLLKFKNAISEKWLGRDLHAGMGMEEVLAGLPANTIAEDILKLREDFPYTELPVQTNTDQFLQLQIKPLNSEGNYLGCIFLLIDFTQERKTGRALLRAEKMAALGTMSARVAHEIRNPLASISGSAQLLGESVQQNDMDRKLLGLIVTESARLERIISELLNYSREPAPTLREVSIAEIFKKIRLMLEKSPNYDENLVITDQLIENGDIRFVSDPDVVVQVILNIALNALQSLKDGKGRLDFTATKDGRKIILKVKDNGCGMSVQDVARAFEPFFTSKPTGTGLGLSTCLHYVQALEGNITLDSQIESGTVVTITLPMNQNGNGLRKNGD